MHVEPPDSPPVVKEEPIDCEVSQIVEEFDSNDGFPDSSNFNDVSNYKNIFYLLFIKKEYQYFISI